MMIKCLNPNDYQPWMTRRIAFLVISCFVLFCFNKVGSLSKMKKKQNYDIANVFGLLQVWRVDNDIEG